MGTNDYVAPEQIRGGSVDGRADVYALAGVLFECLAGHGPFERESELAVVFAHLNEPPPRLTDYRPELPRNLDDVFARGLAKSPDDRYATCGELVDAARAAPAGAIPQRRRRRVGAAAVAAAAGAAVVVVVVAGVGRDGGEPAHAAPAISERSVDGASLGLTMAATKRASGAPGARTSLQEPGVPVLIFRERELSVYFDQKTRRSIIVTTWNPRFRTAPGVGPCSTLPEARAAYGNRSNRRAGTRRTGSCTGTS